MITIVRVCVGRPRPLGDSGLVSAIGKEPVESEELALSELNLDGDDQADRVVHGGRDKAVYVHPSEHLEGWAADLDQPGLPTSRTAPFGENLSTLGATEATACIGDVWTWGDARLQVCQPRWPCQKLTVHRRSTVVGPLMRRSGRTGWYLRVLQAGQVPVRGPIDVAPHGAGVTVADANRAMLDRHLDDPDLVRRLVDLGPVLADEWRLPLVERLDGRGPPPPTR